MTPTRLAISLSVLLFAFLSGAPAPHAQDDDDELETLARLDREARDAVTVGNLEAAILLRKSALTIRELNILYLNLGRTHYHAGQCFEAKEAYEKALRAPKAEHPSPEKVNAAIAKYQRELIDGCPASVTIVCDPPDLRLTVDDEGADCTTPLSLMPGKHTVVGALEDRRAQRTIEVSGMERVSVPLILPPADDQGPPEVITVDQEMADDGNGWLRGMGWATGGLAVASAITGFGVRLSYTDDIDEIEKISNTENGDTNRYNELRTNIEDGDLWMWTSFGAAGALAVTSGILLYLGYSEADSPEAGQIGFGFQPGTAGVSPWTVWLGGHF